MRTEFLCISLLRVASGPRVKLASCKSALNSPLGRRELVLVLFDRLFRLFGLCLFGFVGGGGVVGWCEGAVYLTSLGRPTDIGLQLGKACYPCSG